MGTDKKTVFITGASGGIGGACARVFALSGYDVALHWRSDECSVSELETELRGYGRDTVLVRADLGRADEAEAAVKQAVNSFGKIDALVNAAGAALPQGLFQFTSDADYETVFNANVRSCLNVTRAVLPSMLSRHEGRIINVSSVWGVYGGSCEALYSAAKAAIIGFTKALAREVGPSGVTVNCIAPGVIDTKMNAHLSAEDMKELAKQTPLCRTGTPEEVAAAALFLAGEGAGFITGQVLGVDGGFC